MVEIETQGLSEDYTLASGDFDPVKRGKFSRTELLNLLEIVAKLSTPDGDDKCPPSVNVQLNDDNYTCFAGDNGIIRCLDSQEEEMSPSDALSLIFGDLSISDFDQSKGHVATGNSFNKLYIVLFFWVLLVGIVYLFGT